MSILKNSAEVLKLENEYQMEKLKIAMAADEEVDREVEKWLSIKATINDADFIPEMKKHNRRIIDINRRRTNKLAELKERLLASFHTIKLQQGGAI